MAQQRNYMILSCEVFKHEIELLISEMENPPQVHFLEMGLHERPDLLRERVQHFVAELEKDEKITTLAFAYGLCGQGLAGVTSKRLTLVLPKAHDCIPLLLGVDQDVSGEFSQNGSTYWQSPGWVSYAHAEFIRNKDARFREYTEKYGEDNAQYLMEEQLSWLAHYKGVKLIRWNQLGRMEERAEKNSGFFETEARCFAHEAELPYSQCDGSDTFLKALLDDTWRSDKTRFLVIPPGYSAQLMGSGEIEMIQQQVSP